MEFIIRKKKIDKSFTDLIIERLGLSLEELKEYQDIASSKRKNLLEILVENGYSDEEIAKIKAEYFGYTYDRLTNYIPEEYLLNIFDKNFLKNRLILPISLKDNVLIVAMVEPSDIITLNEMVEILKKNGYSVGEISIIVTTKNQLLEKIDSLFEEKAKLSKILQTLEKTTETTIYKDFSNELKEVTETSSPIIALANQIIEDAYKKGASDIHIQPTENNLRIRFRIDGDLNDYLVLPKYTADAIIARYKIMANMKLDEKRLPQDSRINYNYYNPSINIDLRVSTIPSVYGEDLVMRILDKSNVILDLNKLGFSDEYLSLYRDSILKPYGIILHVGPTGSGKTTTLYSALKEIDKPDIKVLTVEDPVEYQLGGSIVQTNINPAAGYTFAKAIRSFLRHDPDVILVGEIRDLETAKTAVEASLTGHLVFSTLHTNDSVSTITRLEEMGVETYLLADSLLLICAQRLVKKICPHCKEEYKATKKEKIILENAGMEFEENLTLYKGAGCSVCNFTGYKGRTGIHELLKIDDVLKSMIIDKASTEDMKKYALGHGMKTLRQDGLLKALKGITTIEEVVKSTLE
ncbi:MAG TPA: type II/IV secretion system protein [Sulfurihydrogenibium sp.]|jgi:type IV pilus assembly protein PilB|uniref:ATPase, T2SS/T4P/T4SS family n=1 Tax=Sulfurihydrogenibium sp. (strain YO3AOP1) TaxID=436114 RepID=UPI0001724967|nr:GspE/PulE family protein [Sulfurihydrogenibium sp. YO3AOP1]ACD67299.1 type II secretion system protein E [Sulfurihydrogenibium sp. YO3AOP1]HBT98513.1 type II/IV secretion system protein [Sulfurihydrogenibium sp.]